MSSLADSRGAERNFSSLSLTLDISKLECSSPKYFSAVANRIRANPSGAHFNAHWLMGGKAKSRCHLGMLKVNNLRHNNLNVMKLGNYSFKGECLNDTLNLTKVVFFIYFTLAFKIQKW